MRLEYIVFKEYHRLKLKEEYIQAQQQLLFCLKLKNLMLNWICRM